MQRNEGGYNRRDYLDDQGGPGAGRLEPPVQSARAHTKEHAQTLARLCHTVHGPVCGCPGGVKRWELISMKAQCA